MTTLVALLGHLAALGLVVSGVLWTVGLTAARDRAMRFVVRVVALALLLPCAVALACGELKAFRRSATLPAIPWSAPGVPTALLFAVIAGHVVLAAVLLRRRLLGAEAERRLAAELERARGRERERLPPDFEPRDR